MWHGPVGSVSRRMTTPRRCRTRSGSTPLAAKLRKVHCLRLPPLQRNQVRKGIRGVLQPPHLKQNLGTRLVDHLAKVLGATRRRVSSSSWTHRRIGVRGFLTSCATMRAIWVSCSNRSALTMSVTSSTTTTRPPRPPGSGASATPNRHVRSTPGRGRSVSPLTLRATGGQQPVDHLVIRLGHQPASARVREDDRIVVVENENSGFER